MGKTPTITDLQQQNQAFDDYMKKSTANLMARVATQREGFTKSIDEFYGKSDRQLLKTGSHTDYRQTAEFSLGSIDKAITDIAKAVFSGGELSSAKKDAAIAVVEKVAGYEALAIVAARAFITHLLGVFDASASTEFHSDFKNTTLAPGLALHVWHYGDSFHRNDFFNNEAIVENVIEFSVIYSFTRSAMEGDIEYLDEHKKSVDKLEKSIDTMQEDINKRLEDLDHDVPAATLDGWNHRLDYMRTQVEKYRSEIDALVKKKQVTA